MPLHDAYVTLESGEAERCLPRTWLANDCVAISPGLTVRDENLEQHELPLRFPSKLIYWNFDIK